MVEVEDAILEALKADGLVDDFSFRLSPDEAFQDAFLLNITPNGWNFYHSASCKIGWGNFGEINKHE